MCTGHELSSSSSPSSSMALQSNADLRLLYGFFQSPLFFYLYFQFVILHLLTSICTQFYHLLYGCSLSRIPFGLLLNLTFFHFTIHLLTWPIQINRLILTNESISKSQASCINSLLYRFLQISFTVIPSNILLKTLLSKAVGLLPTSLNNGQVSAPYIATGLINVLQTFIVYALKIQIDSVVR